SQRQRTDAAAMLLAEEQSSGSAGALIGIAAGPGHPVYKRAPEPKGPMTVFGYDYLEDRIGTEKAAALGLLRYTGLRGSGGEYAYEVLNLVDGNRTEVQVRNAVSAIYGPVPQELVSAYLAALESAGVIVRVSP
ncbi:MAG TPA: hypothetical protein VFW45_17300, partial [Candidatus Polarisedimenticolia bacterium]|nr:hypothetical protein [Candidatus Polarisedimenticolia bacterium]